MPGPLDVGSSRRKPPPLRLEPPRRKSRFFFQAEDGIRDPKRDWSSDVCSSDLGLVLDRRVMDLRGLVAQAVDQHAWSARRKGLALSIHSGALPSIVADESQMERVVGNLIEIGRASCRERVEEAVDGGAVVVKVL